MSDFFSLEGVLALMLGGLYGSLFGAIPGLTATLAVALFIPIAFFLDPVIALPAIIAISSVSIYAGDVGSVVARIPGTPASAAYLEELHKTAKRKGAIYSLGLSSMGSAIGGVIGTLLLIFAATGIAAVAKQFSSFEYFWIAVLGLAAGVFAFGGSPLKALASLLFGLFLSTVGIDPTLGFPRFHFESPNLLGGLNYIVVMIGLFGFSEVLKFLFKGSEKITAQSQSSERLMTQFYIKPLLLIVKEKWVIFRSSMAGILVGFLPGAGADIGAWVACSIQKMRKSRKDESEETTREKVILAGASSNNSAVASAWIPALSLGLPGDTITAIVLGVFMMKGITPGPLLFEQQPDLLWSLYLTFLIANLFLLPFYGFITAYLAAYLIKIPFQLLLIVITGLCMVGAFAINNNIFDIWVMAAMGFVAFMMSRQGFPLAQVVLGMVLGPILEQNFMVSVIKSHWDLWAFFNRPIAIGLMIATLAVVVVGIYVRVRFRKKAPI
jgi:TctA family transporter